MVHVVVSILGCLDSHRALLGVCSVCFARVGLDGACFCGVGLLSICRSSFVLMLSLLRVVSIVIMILILVGLCVHVGFRTFSCLLNGITGITAFSGSL